MIHSGLWSIINYDPLFVYCNLFYRFFVQSMLKIGLMDPKIALTKWAVGITASMMSIFKAKQGKSIFKLASHFSQVNLSLKEFQCNEMNQSIRVAQKCIPIWVFLSYFEDSNCGTQVWPTTIWPILKLRQQKNYDWVDLLLRPHHNLGCRISNHQFYGFSCRYYSLLDNK